MDSMYNKYGNLANRIPGLSKGMVDNAYGSLKSMLNNDRKKPTPSNKKRITKFDSSKYPRV
jgi:hypothetical protein